MTRALVMDFAADKNTHDINSEYMFGKSILVAPVTEPMYTKDVVAGQSNNKVQDFSTIKSKKVYLPAQTSWYDFWTNEKYEGGQTISKETPLDIMPIYIKAGSIIPFGPHVQYAEEKPWNNLELHIYEDADGTFTLYEDEFDNYNYEKGSFSEIPMIWNNASRTLTIEDRKGSFSGMINSRKFIIILQNGARKEVDYKGNKISVKF